MNIKAVRPHPAAQESPSMGEFNQAILDVGCNNWQEDNSWDHQDMLEHAERTYGAAAKLQWMEEPGNHIEQWFESGKDPFAGSGANRLQPATNFDETLCSTAVFDPFNL
jgi:hypothetical protein